MRRFIYPIIRETVSDLAAKQALLPMARKPILHNICYIPGDKQQDGLNL
jgi:hypothetical protein